MNSLDKLAYNLLETVRSKTVDDDSIDVRQIKSAIHAARGTLIVQSQDKRPLALIPNAWTQVLKPGVGLHMETVDASTIPGLTVEQYIRRSTDKIPSLLYKRDGTPLLKRVSPINLYESNFAIVSHQKAIHSGAMKFTRLFTFAFLYDDYIFLVGGNENASLYEYIDIVGVFSNPSEVYTFNDVDGDSLKADSELDYPITIEMEIPIRQLVIEKFLGIKEQTGEDLVNNGADNAKTKNQ